MTERELNLEILRLKKKLEACRNELCEYCGAYKERHLGACNGCLWLESEDAE